MESRDAGVCANGHKWVVSPTVPSPEGDSRVYMAAPSPHLRAGLVAGVPCGDSDGTESDK